MPFGVSQCPPACTTHNSVRRLARRGSGKRPPSRSDYRGNPLIVLPMGENRDFSFGVGKARVILEHLQAIVDFVNENSAGVPNENIWGGTAPAPKIQTPQIAPLAGMTPLGII